MNALVEIALINALFAGGLALLAFAAGRALRRPALAHALWVLVLLKLLTPPLVEWETGIPLHVAARRPAPDPRAVDEVTLPQPAEITPRNSAPVNLPAVDSAQNDVRTPAVAQRPSMIPQTRAESGEAILFPVEQGDEPLPTFSEAPAPVPLSDPALHSSWSWTSLVPAAVSLWLAGTVAWFTLQGFRLLSFFRMLRRSQPAPCQLQQQTRRLAENMGLRRCPPVRVISGTFAPLMWGLGPRAGLLFPAGLLRRLDGRARATLLVHELAHYRRRDHWVRLLELIAGGLYWWNPVVWWSKRHIEQTEEACCDAWVVSQFSDDPRRYAEALLATVDFLAEAPRPVPVIASSIGDARSIRNRLTSIMLGPAPKRMTPSGRLGLLAMAILLLPLKPAFLNSAPDTASAAPSISAASLMPQPSANEFVRQNPAKAISLSPSLQDNLPAAPALRAPRRIVWAKTTSPDGRSMITAATDRSVSFKNSRTSANLDLSDAEVTTAAFSPDGRLFLTGSLDGRVRLWNARTAELLRIFPAHREAVRTVLFSPDGEMVVSGGRDGRVRTWNLKRRRLPESLSVWTHRLSANVPVNCIRFSPDGRLLAVAAGDWKSNAPGFVTLWNAVTLERLKTFPCDTAAAAVLFSDDGRSLTIAGWPGTVANWDISSGRLTARGTVPKNAVSAAAFSADHELRARMTLHSPVPEQTAGSSFGRFINTPALSP